MSDLEKLAKLDIKMAVLALLTAEGVKPMSRVDSFEGPEKVVSKIIEKLGLTVEIKTEGCKSEILFGSGRGLAKYKDALKLKGGEKVYEMGLAFGYPKCCSKYFSEFLTGLKNEKPDKLKPLEHFSCPNCRLSPSLQKKYQEAYDLFELA
ncbi:MAG: hypothetical protein GOU98_03035 [Candidatus Altiarchaeota archaeon]|nr:hypothetical protein [Candidatus Altiarchaeota archaeon]